MVVPATRQCTAKNFRLTTEILQPALTSLYFN